MTRPEPASNFERRKVEALESIAKSLAELVKMGQPARIIMGGSRDDLDLDDGPEILPPGEIPQIQQRLTYERDGFVTPGFSSRAARDPLSPFYQREYGEPQAWDLWERFGPFPAETRPFPAGEDPGPGWIRVVNTPESRDDMTAKRQPPITTPAARRPPNLQEIPPILADQGFDEDKGWTKVEPEEQIDPLRDEEPDRP